MKTRQIVIGAIAALALAGGGFAAGMTVGRPGGAESARTSASPSSAARTGQGAAGAGGAGRFGGLGASGQQILVGRIIAVNDGSVTVEVRQPGAQGASPTVSSQIVLVGASTRLVRTTEQDIKIGDLKANDQIQVVGTSDPTGSVSATAIVVGGNALQQLFGGGQGGARGSASPSPTR